MRFNHTYAPPGYHRYSLVSNLKDTNGAIKAVNMTTYAVQATPADGDHIVLDFFCKGDETHLELSTRKTTGSGIFDIYINGVLDSSAYDDYVAVNADFHRDITLSQPVLAGYNTVELRVNTKNVASSGFAVCVYGAILQ